MLIVECLQLCANILIVLPQNGQNEHLKWLQNKSSDNVPQLIDTFYYKHTQNKLFIYDMLFRNRKLFRDRISLEIV
jgi:hypothetical protein